MYCSLYYCICPNGSLLLLLLMMFIAPLPFILTSERRLKASLTISFSLNFGALVLEARSGAGCRPTCLGGCNVFLSMVRNPTCYL